MKRLIFLFVAVILCCGAARAQKGLHINELFDNMRNNEHVTETYASSRQLRQYAGLISLYHSLEVRADEKLVETVAAALAKDVGRVEDKDVVYRNGRLRYALYILSSSDTSQSGVTRIIYYSSPTKGRATLIYIEGEAPAAQVCSLLEE